MADAPGTRPAELAALGVERWGETGFVQRCVGLLQTTSWGEEPELMSYMAPAGPRFVEFGLGREGYWLRVWPLRAFLYAWDPRAEQAVVAALSDEHWRSGRWQPRSPPAATSERPPGRPAPCSATRCRESGPRRHAFWHKSVKPRTQPGCGA